MRGFVFFWKQEVAAAAAAADDDDDDDDAAKSSWNMYMNMVRVCVFEGLFGSLWDIHPKDPS